MEFFEFAHDTGQIGGLPLLEHLLGAIGDPAEREKEFAVLAAKLKGPVCQLRRDVNGVVEIAVGLLEGEVQRELIAQSPQEFDRQIRIGRSRAGRAKRRLAVVKQLVQLAILLLDLLEKGGIDRQGSLRSEHSALLSDDDRCSSGGGPVTQQNANDSTNVKRSKL